MLKFNLPVGYHKMHKTKIMDYQLNRWHSFGYTRLEDMQEAARNIKSLADWKGEMVRQAEKALAEGRLMNGTFAYRAAEFFTNHADPDKLGLYKKFQDLFYNQLIKDEGVERHKIPYEGAFLSAMKVPARVKNDRKPIVIHGGFDSFIEELYSSAVYFAERGHDVYLFDGPGQGSSLKEQGLAMDYRWEKPAKAVLDHFNLNDVTWLGISMGGWLCFRAAAYEPRIKRVIASAIAFDYMQIPPKFIADFARWLYKYPDLMNSMAEMKMKRMPQEKWGMENLMYIMKAGTSHEAGMALLDFNEQNLKSELVKQDVLILTGAEDHFIPLKMHHLQVKALKNVKSLTARIFTQEDQAHNHCQVGNFGLALKVMSEWIEGKE